MTLTRLQRGADNPLDEVIAELRGAIFGQDRAIESLARALNRARLGFKGGAPTRPKAVLMFMGPTGVGKTECAKRVARALNPHHPQHAMLSINCGQFAQEHMVSALVGAPASFVGHSQRALLDSNILDEPDNIIVFDEVEKAHSAFWALLLQIMEEGEVQIMNRDIKARFHNSIIILTTNAGAREMGDLLADKTQLGFRTQPTTLKRGAQMYDIGFKALQRTFSPEWINRLDEIIAFRPLTHEHMRRVVDRMLTESNRDYYLQLGLFVELTDQACEHLIAKATVEPQFGARPLRHRLEKDLEAPLADLIASGSVPNGARILVDLEEDDFVFFCEALPHLTYTPPSPSVPVLRVVESDNEEPGADLDEPGQTRETVVAA